MLNPKEKAARLAFIAGQMTTCELYARLWMVRAQLPGADGEHCGRTALVHIQRYNECLEHQDALLRDEVTA